MVAESKQAAALSSALSYPLVEALINRRSRRFSLGAVMPGGGLAYKSSQRSVPLTTLEEALLCFAATGVNGFCLGDIPYQEGDQKEAGGGNVIASLSGRIGASADAIHSAALFIINDEGTSLIRRPQDLSLEDVDGLAQRARESRFEYVYDRMRVPIRAGRTAIPREVPFVFPFNKWSTNLPGTTYFVPVCDISSMYINVILSAFDEQMGLFIVDERANLKPAGVGRFGRSHGGRLHDDPDGGRVYPVLGLETVIVELVLAEQAFMVHNLSLMEQAIGLGGWTHLATATETGWLEALGFRTGTQRVSQILHAGVVRRALLKLLGQDRQYPYGVGLTVDGMDLLKPYCPPYYESMEKAVLAFLDFKRTHVSEARLDPAFAGTWQDPSAVQSEIPKFSDECIAATIAYCTYLYETYGRFPAYFGPMRTTLGHQAHHLDLEFYDRFYHSGAYSPTQAGHMECWH